MHHHQRRRIRPRAYAFNGDEGRIAAEVEKLNPIANT
jgi:hypothetical protein